MIKGYYKKCKDRINVYDFLKYIQHVLLPPKHPFLLNIWEQFN